MPFTYQQKVVVVMAPMILSGALAHNVIVEYNVEIHHKVSLWDHRFISEYYF